MADTFHLLIPLAGLGVYVAAQLLLARAWPRLSYLKVVVVSFVAGLLSLSILSVAGWAAGSPLSSPETLGSVIVNLLIYTGFAFCFFAGFINPAKTSLRIRLFRELQDCPEGLSWEQISRVYDPHRVVELRLQRLLNSKQVTRVEGRYFLNGKLLWLLATTVRTAKLVVIGRESEFADPPIEGRPRNANSQANHPVRSAAEPGSGAASLDRSWVDQSALQASPALDEQLLDRHTSST